MPVLDHDTSPPPSWPPGITYLTRSRLSPTFNKRHLPLLHSSSASSPNKPPSKHPQTQPFPKDLIKIKKITAEGHPAKGQLGLVALKKIDPKVRVIHYTGIYHTRPHPESDYDLSVVRVTSDEEPKEGEESGETIDIALDAARMGGAGRLINDYRGIASRPNCQFVDVVDENGWKGMEVWTLGAGVSKGEELLVSYGRNFWAGRRDG
jgi:hypothetical protein